MPTFATSAAELTVLEPRIFSYIFANLPPSGAFLRYGRFMPGMAHDLLLYREIASLGFEHTEGRISGEEKYFSS